MGASLYKSEPVFKSTVDFCADILAPILKLDLKDLLFCSKADSLEVNEKLRQTAITQPAIFVMEYALAKLWLHYGVKPEAMIGHSIGEYAAACLSEIFTLEDTLKLVAKRGAVIQAMDSGSMLSVPLSSDVLESRLNSQLCIASVNAPDLCVASGATRHIEALQKELHEDGIASKILKTSHAFHSSMMIEAAEEFKKFAADIQKKPPEIPFVSTVTGEWITNEQATDSQYWADQIRRPVLFSKGILTLLKREPKMFIEVGPRNTMTTLVNRHLTNSVTHLSLATLASSYHDENELFSKALSRYWHMGGKIDVSRMFAEGIRNIVSVPSYPFKKTSLWIPPARVDYQGDTKEAAFIASSVGNLNSKTDYDSAGNSSGLTAEQAFLMQIWKELLGVEDISIDDDFFDLGGHSLVGIALLSRIKERYNVDMILSNFLTYSTIRKMAQKISQYSQNDSDGTLDHEEDRQEWTPLVPLSPSGTHPPVYCVAGIGGHAMELKLLGQYLGDDIPFYGLETRGVAGHKPHESIVDMAYEHINAIKQIQPAGPYYLCGYSIGGVIAFEMAKQLKLQNEKVAWLAFIDSESPTLPMRTRLQFRKVQLKRFMKDPQGYLNAAIKRRLNNNSAENLYAHIERATEKAFRTYNPIPYTGTVTLFKTYRDDFIGDIRWVVDEYNGWRNIINGKINLVHVKGVHLSVVQKRENARFLAEKMVESILAADTEN
jgi:thioesterase domain-containing protein/malonyl CoA-acyl carrier protein transacylase/acyl carrier protein